MNAGMKAGGERALPKGLTVAQAPIDSKYLVESAELAKARMEAGKKVFTLDEAKALIQDGDFFHKHHIISNKHKETAKHPLWDAAGIDPNDSRNMMRLPTLEGSKIGTNTRSIHEGRHVGKVNKDLAEKMSDKLLLGEQLKWTQQQYQQELIKIINEEKAVLRSGERALNKHARPRTEHVDANS
jgi:hypothetical protein